MADNMERRKHTRIGVRWPISILTGESTIEGETRNITVSGMFIRCKESLRLNEVYRISVRPPDNPAMELACKVMWSNLIDGEGTAYGMGLYFVKVSDEDLHFLSDIVSAHQQQ